MKEAKFAFIGLCLGEYGVSSMCRALGVTRQGYYQWAKRPESAHDLRDLELARMIGDEYEASLGIYGAPKVFARLAPRGSAPLSSIPTAGRRTGPPPGSGYARRAGSRAPCPAGGAAPTTPAPKASSGR